jgi:hypothetical protein
LIKNNETRLADTDHHFLVLQKGYQSNDPGMAKQNSEAGLKSKQQQVLTNVRARDLETKTLSAQLRVYI